MTIVIKFFKFLSRFVGMLNIFLIFGLFLTLNGHASSDTNLLGEYNSSDYYGPYDPAKKIDLYQNIFQTQDEIFYDNYIQQLISPELNRQKHFLLEQLPNNAFCSDQLLAEHASYLRYLFRLLAMSYLYEHGLERERVLYGLDLKIQNCMDPYPALLKKCRPPSKDMQNFVFRSQDFFNHRKKDFQSFPTPTKKYVEDWMNGLSQKKIDTRDVVKNRMIRFCNDKSCLDLNNKENLSKQFEKLCVADQTLFKDICDEVDQLYGLSQSKGMFEALAQSNALTLVNSQGTAKQCLERFVKHYSSRENYKNELAAMLQNQFERMLATKKIYIQGELFVPGALKSFDMKGLDKFLIALSSSKELFKSTSLAMPRNKETSKGQPIDDDQEKKITVVKTIKPEPIPAPKIEIKEKNEVKKTEEIISETVNPEIPEIPMSIVPLVLSPFEKALRSFEQTGLATSLDMEEMKNQFQFHDHILKALKDPMDSFQRREVLQEMKELDGLGSKNQPVRLLFLWYLIHENQHQGLFNIIGTLGKTFYVKNDLDGKDSPHSVQLANLNQHWQITITTHQTE
jgi:hypothetical protein